MLVTVGLPTGYPWVLTATTGIIFVNVWQSILVTAARKQSGIKYPQLYATKDEAASSKDAHKFNCIQRAHQNTLEVAHYYIVLTLISGIRHPRLAVGLASGFLVARVLYTLGYSTGDPKNRSTGAICGTLALLSLLGTATYTLFQFLSESNYQL